MRTLCPLGASVMRIWLATEFAIGVVYTVMGYQALRFMERSSRKRASIQIA